MNSDGDTMKPTRAERHRRRLVVDEAGAVVRELPLVLVREEDEEMVRRDELEHLRDRGEQWSVVREMRSVRR